MKLVCSLAAVATLAVFAAPQVGAQIPLLAAECFGREATIVGTDGDDVLEGTAQDDVIAALGGDDTIRGLGGHDTICGGSGSDEIQGGKGSDGIAVGRGADDAAGGAGFDLIVEFSSDGCGPCSPVDPDSRDVSTDLISGGPGPDALGAEGGNDVVAGGDGQDIALILSRFTSVSIDLPLGRAVSTAGGIDELRGIEHALGSINPDVLRGDANPNTLIGLWGEDLIDGGGGADRVYASFTGSTLVGGEDESQDTLLVGWDEPTLIDLAAGIAMMQNDDALFHRPDAVARFENVVGGSGDDQILGDASSNKLEGGFGHDEVSGRGGDDNLLGEYDHEHGAWLGDLPGNDVLDGGDGKDRLDGGPLVDECSNGEAYVSCERRSGGEEAPGAAARPGRALSLPWWWSLLDVDYLQDSPGLRELVTSLR